MAPWLMASLGVIVLAAGVFIGRRLWWAFASRGLEESSTEFDIENVRPFLERISSFIASGFGPREIDRVIRLVEAMEHEEERGLAFKIVHQGQRSLFRVGIFMDDVDSPALIFLSPPALAAEIDAEMDRFFKELGI